MAEVLGRWHHWTLPEYGNGDKEDVTVESAGMWRKQPCVVEVVANRYTSGPRDDQTWTGWRVYVRRASAVDPQNARIGDLSDTARRRLGDEFVPEVEAWLESEAYAESRRAAITQAIRSEFPRDGAHSHGSITTVVRQADRLAHELAPQTRRAIAEAVGAWRVYEALVEAIA